MTDYTIITPAIEESYFSKFTLKSEFKMQLARDDPSIFAYYMMGFKPYDYQDLFLNDNSRFKIVCIGRQAGKTTMTAVQALHKAFFFSNTRVVVFSRNESQSKRLLGQIRDFMELGDKHMSYLTKQANLFTSKIDTSKPNNTSQITLKNGSTIVSLPATDGARGHPADLAILDEAAFMDDGIFEKVIEPMITHTGGDLILLSTPNGQRGFFHDIFDPESTGRHDEYSKYWFPSTICPEETVRSFVAQKEKSSDRMTFDQEYMALFTSSKSSYFKSAEIDECLSEDLEWQDSEPRPCYMGVDWGKKNDQTVIAIVSKDEDYVRLVYLYAFPLNTNYQDVIDQIGSLRNRFNVQKIIADYGAGDAQVSEIESRGWNVEGFGFSLQSKLKIFSNLKRMMEKRILKFPKDKDLINEFRAFEYEITVHGNMKLHHPKGGHDDRLDALALACKEYDNEQHVGVFLV